MKAQVKKDIVWNKPKDAPVLKGTAPDIKPTSADNVIGALTERGYDQGAQLRYCKAARSWTERGSRDWDVYKECEARLSSPKEV